MINQMIVENSKVKKTLRSISDRLNAVPPVLTQHSRFVGAIRRVCQGSATVRSRVAWKVVNWTCPARRRVERRSQRPRKRKRNNLASLEWSPGALRGPFSFLRVSSRFFVPRFCISRFRATRSATQYGRSAAVLGGWSAGLWPARSYGKGNSSAARLAPFSAAVTAALR